MCAQAPSGAQIQAWKRLCSQNQSGPVLLGSGTTEALIVGPQNCLVWVAQPAMPPDRPCSGRPVWLHCLHCQGDNGRLMGNSRGVTVASVRPPHTHRYNTCSTVAKQRWKTRNGLLRKQPSGLIINIWKKHVFFFSRQNKKQTFTLFTFKAGFAGLATDNVSSIRAAELHLSKYFR